MAKTIKFNLVLDNHPIRNLKDLQEHFSIEDMLHYFNNGLLLRWLDVRGYQKQLDDVKHISRRQKPQDIIAKLIRIFEISLAEHDIEKGIKILDYLEESKAANEQHKRNAFKKKEVIVTYHRGYEKLIKHMIDFRDDMPALKADAIQLEREYLELFKLDYGALYYLLEEKAPKAVFAILTRDAFRDYWLGNGDSTRWSSKRVYENIQKNLLTGEKPKQILGDDLKIVKRNTEAMWDEIERPEVKVMVISISSAAFVKNAGKFSEKLGYDDINGKFIKLNGLEYQCNNGYAELWYMEV